MSYDFVAVGGTGQWLLLDLLLRARRGEGVELPNDIWVVDPHLPGEAGTLPTLLEQVSNETRTIIKRVRPRYDEVARNSFDDVLNEALTPPENYQPLRDVIEASLTAGEKTYSTRRGFFALPRLAAAWVALSGFEFEGRVEIPFLDPDYVGRETPDPLVFSGSLVGGTGAGLLPQLLLRARGAAWQQWKRPVVVQAVLPWFNPEHGEARGAAETVAWDYCLHNAADGVRALHKMASFLRSCVPAGHGDIPATVISFCGISPSVAKDIAPPSEVRVQTSGVTPPFVRTIADSLLLLSTPRDAQALAPENPVVIAAGVVPAVAGEVDPYSWYGGSNGFVAVQMETLANEIAAKKERTRSGPLSLHRGFGETIGSVLVARGLEGFSSKDSYGRSAWDHYWDGWYARMKKRIEALDKSTAIAVAIAKDVTRTIKQLDARFADQKAFAPVLARANGAPENSAVNGAEFADRIVDAAIAAYETDPSRGKRTAFARLIPAALEIVRACEATLDALTDQELRRLADLYEPLTWRTFYGASYARTLGQALKLGGLIETAPEADIALYREHPVIVAMLTLWRAAVRGLLEIRSMLIDPGRRPIRDLLDHEKIDLDLGPSATSLWYKNVLVGFCSLDLGFVPHCEVIDVRGKVPEPVRALEACRQAMASAQPDLALLHAFAKRFVQGNDAARTIPWVRLLLGTADDTDHGDASAYLEGHSYPALPIALRVRPMSVGSHWESVVLPRMLEQPALEAVRSVSATEHAQDLFIVRGADLFYRGFEREVRLARLSVVGGRTYASELVSLDSFIDAARQVERGGRASIFVTSWRG
jgi:hypothetical protein